MVDEHQPPADCRPRGRRRRRRPAPGLISLVTISAAAGCSEIPPRELDPGHQRGHVLGLGQAVGDDPRLVGGVRGAQPHPSARLGREEHRRDHHGVTVVGLRAVILVVGGAHVELDVGGGQAAAAAMEGDDLGDGGAQRARAPQQPLGQEPRVLGDVQRVGVRHPPDDRDERVVLEVAANARQLVAHVHADGPQLVRRSDPRQLEELWRADRAGRQHHLALGAQDLCAAAPGPHADADGALALELNAQHRGAGCAPPGWGARGRDAGTRRRWSEPPSV